MYGVRSPEAPLVVDRLSVGDWQGNYFPKWGRPRSVLVLEVYMFNDRVILKCAAAKKVLILTLGVDRLAVTIAGRKDPGSPGWMSCDGPVQTRLGRNGHITLYDRDRSDQVAAIRAAQAELFMDQRRERQERINDLPHDEEPPELPNF